MTEHPPSAGALHVAETFVDTRERWHKLARRIDALCEQRVSAETERWQNRDRQRLEQISALQAAVQSFQSAPAERPALEGPQLSPDVADYTERARSMLEQWMREWGGETRPYAGSMMTDLQMRLAAALSAVASEHQAALLAERRNRQDAERDTERLRARNLDLVNKHDALLARLQGPDVREAVKAALEQGRPHWITGVGPGRSGLGGMADAAITKIAEMLK